MTALQKKKCSALEDKMIDKYQKGTLKDGRPVYAYTLENEWLQVEVMDLGATLTKFVVKEEAYQNTIVGAREEVFLVGGKEVRMPSVSIGRDIVLGYDTIAAYEEEHANIGATIGRFANRIAEGKVVWNGEERLFDINNEPNHLHGGSKGIKHHLFSSLMIGEEVRMMTRAFEAEDGYPGDLSVTVCYSLEGKSLRIRYLYSSTEDSFANITNHAYFNLHGVRAGKDVLDHQLTLHTDKYTPFGEYQIPTGDIASVKGTIYDFTEPKVVGEVLEVGKEELLPYRGFDHNYVYTGAGEVVPMATIFVEDLVLQISSDAPCAQLYTGNWLNGEVGKGQVLYSAHSGICVEPQHIPNDINFSKWKNSYMIKDTVYERTIVFSIDTKN